MQELKNINQSSTKKKKKDNSIVLLAKAKLNIEILIFKASINLYINHDEIALVNNVLRENQKSWNCCGMCYIVIVNISTEPYEKNGVETIADIDMENCGWMKTISKKD